MPKTDNWIFDNGAFPAWVRGQIQLDVTAFYRCLNLISGSENLPYFVVVPDIINPSDPENFKRSLKFSLAHIDKIPDHIRKYFVIQPGMGINEVLPVLDKVTGLFLGGGDQKYQERTAEFWRDFTRDHGLLFHIGKVGTREGYDFAFMVGADSVDGSTPMRHQDLERITRWRAAPLGNQRRIFDYRIRNMAASIDGMGGDLL